jgi:hypothetical protein
VIKLIARFRDVCKANANHENPDHTARYTQVPIPSSGVFLSKPSPLC